MVFIFTIESFRLVIVKSLSIVEGLDVIMESPTYSRSQLQCTWWNLNALFNLHKNFEPEVEYQLKYP